MTRLWGKNEKNQWARFPLVDGDEFFVQPTATQPVEPKLPSSSLPEGVAFAVVRSSVSKSASSTSDGWILVHGRTVDISINGERSPGVVTLKDKDEIRFSGGGRLFFSREVSTVVEPFPGVGRAIDCPRCCDPLRVGWAAVRCHECGLWYHQHDANEAEGEAQRHCFTYGPECCGCSHRTALNLEASWTPEGL